nr:vegetative cell wall protein gp1-like [Crassostrea gigas]
MENQRSNLENWIYQWNEDQQRFVRAQRRDPHPTEGPQQQSTATQTVTEIEGVPQHQTSTTPTVSFAGTNFRLRPTVLFPRRPIGVTSPSSAPARPPAPAVTSPVIVRPNTSLGQVYHTDGTVSAPESLSGQRVNRSQKRTRDGGEDDETEESPRSRARWVSPFRPSRPPLPDAPDSPDPSPPASPRSSPTPIVIPDTPPPSPPLGNIRRRLGARPAPDRPAPPAPTRPAPDRTAPPPPERPPPVRPAPDRPAPPPPIRPRSPQVPVPPPRP